MKNLTLSFFYLFTIYSIGNTQTVCNDIFADDIEVFDYDCQSGTIAFCLPVDNLSNYDIFLNNELQTDFQPCGELTQTNIYTFSSLKSSNPPFELESWTVDGITFNSSFNTLQELVDSLNIWDSPVIWTFNEVACAITSSDSSNDYSNMIVNANSNSGTIVFDLSVNIIQRPSAFSLETSIQSSYPFEIVNKIENCVDNILIEDQDIETNSQVNCQNFAPIGATWHFQNFNLQGDGKLFSKIVSDRDTIVVTAQGESVRVNILEVEMNGTPIPEARIFIRESENKVYFFEDDEFKLLYDFNIEVGDVFTVNVPRNRVYYDFSCTGGGLDNEFQTVIVVDSIGFVEVQNKQFKEIYTSSIEYPYYYGLGCYNFGKITERIGGELGLFGQNCSQCLSDFPGHVRCYSDNLFDIKLVEEDCDFGINTSTFNVHDSNIKVYPNPAKDNLFIDSDVDISSYRFTDLSGRVLINQDYITRNKLKLNSLSPGLYFVQLFDSKENLIYTKRIIKQ